MKIYTKTGDKGETSLFSGTRVKKYDPLIETIGNIDELNSLLGVVVSTTKDKVLVQKLVRIQSELFQLGADLATPLDSKLTTKIKRITDTEITNLEKEIDKWEQELPALKNFILPGGSIAGSYVHLARSLARRAERRCFETLQKIQLNPTTATYLNRLSDWLFVLARKMNQDSQVSENIWRG